jgi:hypothetical protein
MKYIAFILLLFVTMAIALQKIEQEDDANQIDTTKEYPSSVMDSMVKPQISFRDESYQ